MASPAMSPTNSQRRRSILDLAPFELDCMNALWPLGEATVKQVQDAISAKRPRAYTTIMTILDRLAQKGIVARRKQGRAYLYRANLQPTDAQESAIEHVVDGFFGGSREALTAHLTGKAHSDAVVETKERYRALPPREMVKAGVKEAADEEIPTPTELDRTLL